MTKGAAHGAASRPSPWAMPWAEWRSVLKRTWREIGDDDISLIAAGAAFYGFLAIVPALGAIVLLYGLLAEPETVREHIGKLFEVLPPGAAAAVADQLADVVQTSGAKKGLGLLLALAFAIYGATKGAAAIRTALNIAYGLKERRGFVRLQLLAIGVVLGGLAIMLLALATNAMLAWISAAIPSPLFELLLKLISYVVLGALVLTAAACLYRFGPNHKDPRWAWLSPGAAAATLLWLAGTAGFGVYASNFANYGATYGSLSAVVVLLTWLWLSAFVFLLGAELNSELECEIERSAPDPVAPPAAESPPPLPASIAPPSQGGTVRNTLEVKTIARISDGRLPLGAALIAGAGFSQLRRGSAIGFVLVAGSVALAWATRPRG